MPANTTPIFPITQKIGRAVCTTADTSYTAPTTNGATLITAGTNGTRIDGAKIRALGSNIATVIRFFVFDGTNYTLVHEAALAASTADADGITGVDYLLLPLNYDNAGGGVLPPYLPAGSSIVVAIGTTVAAGYAVTAYGGDY